VFVRKNGETHYLWRTIDHEGEVLEAFVAKRRDRKAALKFLKRTMKRFGAPKVIVTDRLRSYRAGHCQTNSQCLRERPGSQTSGRELAPFGQSGSAVMFKNITAVQMALLVEKVMDRGMDGGEFLEGAGVPELGHRFFSPSERLVRILCPIVKPTAAFLAGCVANDPHRRMV
jgi:hypothetical protein